MDHRHTENVDYAEMLYQFKSTVEGLLDCQSTNVWNVYGGLNRLHLVVSKIFKHGFRIYKQNGEPDCWIFIQGLSWLQPTLAASPSFVGNYNMSQLKSPVRHYDKPMTWLYKSIESHTLSDKLCWLLSDQEHLVSCYNSTAYLRQGRYSEATLICLRAVEQNQSSLLTDIDPTLYMKKKIIVNKAHRRCQSYPENKTNDMEWFTKSKQTILSSNEAHLSALHSSFISSDKNSPYESSLFDSYNVQSNSSDSFKILNLEMLESIFKPTEEEVKIKKNIKNEMLKKNFSISDLCNIQKKCNTDNQNFPINKKQCQSLPDVFTAANKTAENTTLSDILKVDYNYPKKRNTQIKRNDSIDSLFSISSINTVVGDNNKNNKVKVNHKHKRRHSSIFKLPFRIWEESSDETQSICSDGSKTLVAVSSHNAEYVTMPKRKSFIEDNGNIPLPMSIGFFPKPSPGQSLISFLSSGMFTQATAELDRENAHFSISEAMIATIEQVKCNRHLHNADEMLEESDEEINQLKRSIRIRRRQKQEEKQLHSDSAFFSSETNDTMTTDQSVSSLSSSVYSTSESISTDTEYENEAEENCNLLTVKKSGLSVSKLSLYSDKFQTSEHKMAVSISAESVAISLLRRFNEDQLPAASEIEWLVSENDAPQKILPLPSSISVSSNEPIEENSNTLLRGTLDWAPPRPQIIFTPHPHQMRKVLMEKQRYRCAGCSMKVAQKYACKFRYCEYLGRYFCTDCHTEKTAVLPGKVLSKWDFSKCPVSNFSYKLLDQMSTDPLFNINDLNSALYNKVRNLKKIRSCRFQLLFIKDFIFTCKFPERLKQLLKKEQPHILSEPDCYSLQDLIQVKNGKLLTLLSELINSSINHVNNCQFCQMRGFICELCNNCKVIFPWNLELVFRCNKCGSCYHTKCFSKIQICPKCLRRSNRHDRQNSTSGDCIS